MEDSVFEIILIIIFIPFSLALLGLVYHYLYLRVLCLSHQDLDKEDRKNRMMIRGGMAFSSDLPEHIKGRYEKKFKGMQFCLKVLAVCALALIVYGIVQQL